MSFITIDLVQYGFGSDPNIFTQKVVNEWNLLSDEVLNSQTVYMLLNSILIIIYSLTGDSYKLIAFNSP